MGYLKFTFSEKATIIDKIFTVDLTVCSNRQINGEDLVKLYGLLRKHEIYYIESFDLMILCDLVTVFTETKSVTKSRLHCSMNYSNFLLHSLSDI